MNNSLIKFLVLLACIFAGSIAETANAATLSVYTCGKSTVTVSKTGSKYSVRMRYSTSAGLRRHVVTINSEPATLKTLTGMFEGGELAVNDETEAESGLPKGSLAFTGFHFSGGGMYVSAEGETNEEGYTFAAEKGLLEGAATVQAAEIFWYDRSESEVTKHSCTLNRAKSDYDLKDENILGLYKLQTADKKSELQKAELIYNNDNVLVVVTDRNDMEYELSPPNKNGVVFEGEDEPNCGGEEAKCWYDSKTIIKLLSAKVDGKEIPQLAIEITQSNAWDEEGKDDSTSTYVLNWNKKLGHSIPYFINIENPELDKLVKSCSKALAKLEFENGASYLNSNDVCPFPRSVQLREPFAKSLDVYMKYLTEGGRTKRVVEEVTAAELKTKVFGEARELARKYKPKKSSSPSRTEVLDQIDKVEAFAAKGDIIYTYRYIRDAAIVVVDSKIKRASTFNIKVTDKFEY